jgi:serine/threonine-protein kinase
MTQVELARQDALDGDHDACLARLRDLEGLQPAATILRSASWCRSADETAELAAAYLAEKGAGWDEERPRLYLSSLARELDGEGLARRLGELEPVFHPRWRALANQLACESLLWLGRPDLAEGHLRAAGEALLLDLVWLDRCPLLESLRDTSSFEEVRRRTRVRGVRIWS